MARKIHVEIDIDLQDDDPYYRDSEVPSIVESWLDSSLYDRDDVVNWSVISFPVQYY